MTNVVSTSIDREHVEEWSSSHNETQAFLTGINNVAHSHSNVAYSLLLVSNLQPVVSAFSLYREDHFQFM